MMPTLFNKQKPIAPPDFVASPFPHLSLTNILGRGGASLILSFPHRTVFKTPHKFHVSSEWSEKIASKARSQQALGEWSMQNEKAVYTKIAFQPHRNLLRALLVVDEGIFLPRMSSTLETYLQSWSLGYPETSPETKHQWITQLTAGAAWLERLGLVHGDIRPSNIFIDHRNNAKLADFGEIGFPEQMHQPWLDQYGIGQCIWALFHQRLSEDFFDLPGDWEDPQTLALPLLKSGPTSLIERCLRIQFASLHHLHQTVLAELNPSPSIFSLLRLGSCVSNVLWDIMDSVNHWIAAWRCRRLYSRLRQDDGKSKRSPNSVFKGTENWNMTGPDLPTLDFAYSRNEMDIPGFVSPISINRF
ncbi:MAG: hypothetical protein Q9224_003597 [Gallowayella concinna]